MQKKNNTKARKKEKPLDPEARYQGLFVPLGVAQNAALSHAAKLLWGWIRYHGGRDGNAYPSQAKLASELGGLSRWQITRCAEELEDADLLRVIQGGGRRGTSRYVLLDHPSLRTKTSAPKKAKKPKTSARQASDVAKMSHQPCSKNATSRCSKNAPQRENGKERTLGRENVRASSSRARDEKPADKRPAGERTLREASGIPQDHVTQIQGALYRSIERIGKADELGQPDEAIAERIIAAAIERNADAPACDLVTDLCAYLESKARKQVESYGYFAWLAEHKYTFGKWTRRKTGYSDVSKEFSRKGEDGYAQQAETIH